MRCEGCKHYLKGGSACGLCYCYDRFEPKDYPPYLDYPKERKPLTYYDRLISKTPEELAEWCYENADCPPERGYPDCGKTPYDNGDNCKNCWLDYLNEECKKLQAEINDD